ncbi:unnamed protein product [Chondrus crispus]|uniref:BZIP domain-containing protein n=1 Tax=Chondrus crispus TaxID=2769 RepID=R7QEE1_CHOCR|nr:unnamed protein product [Chondrus crispus]CDF36128.1 unnamed protein product [Chondrus crispus]|eukprot:XP_005715947.1 unnamed protein product [Chondrus crispus]
MVDRFCDPLICDFLFADEPLHIQPLTSPDFARACFVSELLCTRVASAPTLPLSNPHAWGFDNRRQKTAGNYLFSHRMTLNQLTLGVGVLEVTETMENAAEPDPEQAVTICHDLRFMYDSVKRQILVVMDVPETEHVIIQTAESDSAIEGYIFLATFRRRELRDLIRNRRAELSISTLMKELIGSVHTSRMRSCPTCGGGPASACTCYARLAATRRAKHLFDPDLFKFSIIQDFGDYFGVTSKVLYDRGKRMSRSKLGAQLSLRANYDPDVAERLRNWSLTKFARGQHEWPNPSLRLTGGSRRQSQYDDAVVMYGEDGDRELLKERSPIEQLEPLLDQLSTLHIEDDDDDEDEDDGGGDVAVTEANLTEPGGEQYSHLLLSEPVAYDVASPVNSQVTSQMTNGGAPLRGMTMSPSMTTENSSTAPDWFQLQSSSDMLPAAGPDAQTVSSAFEAESLVVPLPSQQVPAPVAAVQSFSPGTTRTQVSILQDLQAARRRVRNRASANRSNQRKRAIRDKVAADLKNMKDRCEELRKEEVRLRAENMELRKSLRDPEAV